MQHAAQITMVHLLIRAKRSSRNMSGQKSVIHQVDFSKNHDIRLSTRSQWPQYGDEVFSSEQTRIKIVVFFVALQMPASLKAELFLVLPHLCTAKNL